MSDFVNSNNEYIGRSSMIDEHQIISISEKTPTPQNIGKIVRGDTNSNILTFEMNRYYDGIDLSDKVIKILVNNNVDHIFVEDAVNLQTTDELIRFAWVMSLAATQRKGTIKAAIEIYGEEDDKEYVFKTLPFSITIQDTLDTSDIPMPYPDWLVLMDMRVTALEDQISEGTGGGGGTGTPGRDGKTYTPKIGTVTSGETASASVDINEEELTATFNFVLPTSSGSVNSSMSYEETLEFLNSSSTEDAIDPPPNTLKIVTFQDGTDEELKAMLDAHYAGQINIHDYWNVGDERTVHLSAMDSGDIGESHVEQDVQMILVNSGEMMLSDNNTECAFVVMQKDPLKNGDEIEVGSLGVNGTTSDYSTYTWGNSKRKQWCNDTYYNSIAEGFRGLIRQHINKYNGGKNGKTLRESTDYCVLPCESDIVTDNLESIQCSTQFEYYKNNSTPDDVISNFWTRSRCSTASESSTKYVHFVNIAASSSSGNRYYSYTSYNSDKKGIRPVFCI